MLQNFLIGLREGLEAALIVAILVAYLVKLDARDRLPRLWAGVGLAVGLSVLVALGLTVTGNALDDEAAETFAGLTSLLAVGLITWMVLWMAQHGRQMRAHLHGKVDQAVVGSGWGLAVVAFVAVIREGLETALFLFASAESSESGSAPWIGGLLGLAVAVAIGLLMYRGVVRVDLGRLFWWTGLALIIIAAGVLRYAVHELQEVGMLPGVDEYVLDLTGVLAADGVVAQLIRAVFNVVPAMTALELFAWAGYLIVMIPLFVRAMRVKSAAPKTRRAPAVPDQAAGESVSTGSL